MGFAPLHYPVSKYSHQMDYCITYRGCVNVEAQ